MRGEITVPQYVWVYDGRRIHLQGGTPFEGRDIDIHAALKHSFKYNDLMGLGF